MHSELRCFHDELIHHECHQRLDSLQESATLLQHRKDTAPTLTGGKPHSSLASKQQAAFIFVQHFVSFSNLRIQKFSTSQQMH